MKGKCVIDMWHGEAYDRTRHFAPVAYWSDDSYYHWGWIYDAKGKRIGDWNAPSLHDASNALGVKWRDA